MNYKSGLVMLVVAAVGIAFGALAEKQTSGKRVLLLRAGRASAELHIFEGNDVILQNTGNTRLVGSGSDGRMMSATGGFVLKITSGTNSITIQADELVSVP